jgi:hypothetical protein
MPFTLPRRPNGSQILICQLPSVYQELLVITPATAAAISGKLFYIEHYLSTNEKVNQNNCHFQ